MPIISNFPALGGGTPGPDYSSWFGTGEDGDLTVSTDVALPVALDSGQIIKQYNNLTVTSTGVLHPANRCNGMILLVKGDLTVDGTIHVDKCAPLLNDSEELAAQEKHVDLCGELTGGKGGDGGNGDTDKHIVNDTDPKPRVGAPGTGGAGFRFGGGFGAGSGGGARNNGYAGANGDRAPYGTTIPFVPSDNRTGQYGSGGGSGSGPGGGGPGGSGSVGANTQGNSGDAIGGGALYIFVGGKVRINGTAAIRSTGGNGATGVGNGDLNSTSGHKWAYAIATGGGGGGGGGIVVIVHTGDIINSGAVTALGGPGGKGISYTEEYASWDATATSSDGANGSSGTVLMTNISDLLATRVQQAFTALNILGVKT